jgi:plasmid stabilization system protein ParE
MAIQWSDFALGSLEEIILYYEVEAGLAVADAIENRIFAQIEKIASFPMSLPESELYPGTASWFLTICRMWHSFD